MYNDMSLTAGQNCKQNIYFLLSQPAFQLPEILGAAGDHANVEGWAKKERVWAKNEKSRQRKHFVAISLAKM